MLLNYLKPMAIFASVVETGNFTQAGKRLGMPKSRVSEQVSKLEAYLAVKLFIRSTRNVNITAEGQSLYDSIAGMLPAAQSAVNEVKRFSEEVKGVIKITTTPDFYELILVPILKKFSQKHKGVQYDFLITEEPVSIIENSIDIAIRSGDLPDSSLISFPLMKTKLKIYAGQNFSEYSIEHPNELAKFDWISVSRINKMARLNLENNSGEEFHFIPKYKHQASGITSYNVLLEQGFGIGFMPEDIANELLEQEKIIPILSDWHSASMKLSILYPAKLHVAHRTRLLIDEIKNELKRTW